MKCPVCKDYDFEHPLDLEKHALTTHGSSAEKLALEASSARRSAGAQINKPVIFQGDHEGRK